MKAIERLNQYIRHKRINNSNFEKQIGLSNGYIGIQLKRNSDIGEGLLNRILENCIDMNPEWLLTGRGEMLRSEGSPAVVSANANNKGIISVGNVYYNTKQTIKEQAQTIGELTTRNKELEKDKEHLLSQQKAYTDQIERQASQIERQASQIERQASQIDRLMSQIERQASQIERLTEPKG